MTTTPQIDAHFYMQMCKANDLRPIRTKIAAIDYWHYQDEQLFFGVKNPRTIGGLELVAASEYLPDLPYGDLRWVYWEREARTLQLRADSLQPDCKDYTDTLEDIAEHTLILYGVLYGLAEEAYYADLKDKWLTEGRPG